MFLTNKYYVYTGYERNFDATLFHKQDSNTRELAHNCKASTSIYYNSDFTMFQIYLRVYTTGENVEMAKQRG